MRNSGTRKDSLRCCLDTTREQINTFVEQLTEDQYESLATGSPNNSTKIQLAKLLIDVLTSVSKMCKQQHPGTTEEQVRGLLGNSLAQMFADALGLQEAACTADAEHLYRLIGQEVAEMVRGNDSDVSGHITSPCRLDTIIQQTAKMLQTLVAEAKNAEPFRRKQPKVDPKLDGSIVSWMSENLRRQSKVENVESTSARDGGQEMVRRGEESEHSPEGCLSRPNSPVKSALLEELSGITSPLLQDVPEAQAEVVYLQTSEEMKAVLADLSVHKVKNRRAFKSALLKVKTFFSKSFTKALIHCKVAELKADFQTGPRDESQRSLRTLARNVDSLLNSLHADSEHRQCECIFSCDDPTFSGLLFNVIHKGLTETDEYETAVETRVVLSPESGSMEADIRDKMNKFMVLSSWWMNTQLGSCCERVMVTLKHSQSARRVPTTEAFPDQLEVSEEAEVKSEPPEDEYKDEDEDKRPERLRVDSQQWTPFRSEISDPDRLDYKDLEAETFLDERVKEVQQKNTRIYIETLVELLVSRLVHKAKFAVEDQVRILNTLSEATFAQLEQCASTELDPERLTGLRKNIYKDLCRDFGSADNILFLLATNDQSVVSCTATVIQYRLTCPKKHGLV